MGSLTVGFGMRLAQAFIEASLTLVIGVIIAAIIRRMVGPQNTRKIFGRGFTGLFRGWLIGMLLPVCSLAVIPVARELRRSGVAMGAVLAFILAAPLLNPISFLYGLTLAEPVVILTFAAASLLLATIAGIVWDRVFAGANRFQEDEALAAKADAEPLPAEGPRRILSVLVSAAKELTGRDLAFYAIGITGSALLSALIPYASLQHTMYHDDPTSPLLMAAVGIPIYSSPLPGMMKIGLMFDHGNSIGAAFVLFVLGIGTSLGTLAWLYFDFGRAKMLGWVATYMVVVLGLAYASEPLLYDTRKAEEDHTHAFDDYCAPFQFGTSVSQAFDVARAKLADQYGPLESTAVYSLAILIGIGLICRRLDRDGQLERWLVAKPTEVKRTALDVQVPPVVLGMVTLAGMIAFSVAGAYLYYPDQEYCFKQMSAAKADAFSAMAGGKPDAAIRQLEQFDLLVRKLEVGQFIRNWGVTKDQAHAAEELREAIEQIRDLLLAKEYDQAKSIYLNTISEPYDLCKEAFDPTFNRTAIQKRQLLPEPDDDPDGKGNEDDGGGEPQEPQ